MRWHADIAHHPNQFGFALTVSYIDTSQLEDTDFSFACQNCGVDQPQAVLEISLFIWTLFVVTHKEAE